MLSERDLRIAKLKAAIYESRNIERLISKAIRAYEDPRLKTVPRDEITIYFGDKYEKEIVVKDVPMIEFNGEIYEDLQVTATIEDFVNDYIDYFVEKNIMSVQFEDLFLIDFK